MCNNRTVVITPLISICIPACERPSLLLEAVRSCLQQTYMNIEVVITDDTRSTAVRDALASMPFDSRLRYYWNEQKLYQGPNVNRSFALALGERVVLLHDDDVLLPHAIETLAACCDAGPAIVVSYGKPYIISHSGRVLDGVSRATDHDLCREARYAGHQVEALWSVLARQFPPDAFMVRTDAARTIGYRSYEEVGDACDLDFALRLAIRYGGFFYVDHYVSLYRYTDVSISTDTRVDPRYALVRDLRVLPMVEEVKREYLDWAASSAIRRCLLNGERAQAWQIVRERRRSVLAALWLTGPANVLLLILPRWAARAAYRVRLVLRPLARRYNLVYGLRNALLNVCQTGPLLRSKS